MFVWSEQIVPGLFSQPSFLNDFIRQILSVWRRSFPLLADHYALTAQVFSGLWENFLSSSILTHQLVSTVRHASDPDLAEKCSVSLLWDRCDGRPVHIF